MAGISILLTKAPLNAQTCIDEVRADSCGAIALFLGTVRDETQGNAVERLEYEGYEPMAVKIMQEIGTAVKTRWNAAGVAIHHRVGTLAVGDIAVVIAVSTPHRAASFEACQYAIDTLKERVPIWKKEFFEDGASWVMPHP